MDLTLHTFWDTAQLDQALATFVASRLREALQVRGAASLALSGGKTPAGFFRRLAAEKLEWSKVLVTLVDERWVDEDSPYSNARTVRANLLQGEASQARFIPLYKIASSCQDTARLVAQDLADLPETLDVVVLGMGEDGHTASFFPDSPQLHAALSDASGRACIAVEGKAPVIERITLTAPRLAACRSMVLHITGESKWDVLGQAVAQPSHELPIGLMLNTPCESKHVFWTR